MGFTPAFTGPSASRAPVDGDFVGCCFSADGKFLVAHTCGADGEPSSTAAVWQWAEERLLGLLKVNALENERLRSQLLFYATAPLGRAAAKARGGARSKSAHSLTMPLPPV